MTLVEYAEPLRPAANVPCRRLAYSDYAWVGGAKDVGVPVRWLHAARHHPMEATGPDKDHRDREAAGHERWVDRLRHLGEVGASRVLARAQGQVGEVEPTGPSRWCPVEGNDMIARVDLVAEAEFTVTQDRRQRRQARGPARSVRTAGHNPTIGVRKVGVEQVIAVLRHPGLRRPTPPRPVARPDQFIVEEGELSSEHGPLPETALPVLRRRVPQNVVAAAARAVRALVPMNDGQLVSVVPEEPEQLELDRLWWDWRKVATDGADVRQRLTGDIVQREKEEVVPGARFSQRNVPVLLGGERDQRRRGSAGIQAMDAEENVPAAELVPNESVVHDTENVDVVVHEPRSAGHGELYAELERSRLTRRVRIGDLGDWCRYPIIPEDAATGRPVAPNAGFEPRRKYGLLLSRRTPSVVRRPRPYWRCSEYCYPEISSVRCAQSTTAALRRIQAERRGKRFRNRRFRTEYRIPTQSTGVPPALHLTAVDREPCERIGACPLCTGVWTQRRVPDRRHWVPRVPGMA